MGEVHVLSEEVVSYEGLFDAKEIYRIMDEYFSTKGYDKDEAEHREIVTPEGKDIHIIYRPYKKISDYFQIRIRIDVDMRKLTDVEVEIDRKRKHMKKGEVNFKFTTMLESDYEGRWEQNAIYYFIRNIFDKFIYKKQTTDFQEVAKKDTAEIKDRLGAYLNLQRYRK
ncbi:MAG: hypothetical protein KJ574_02260 [Nanoarchaeota archaeon]|nr:hypothetical protein [Nanoarchaeota archaeon]